MQEWNQVMPLHFVDRITEMWWVKWWNDSVEGSMMLLCENIENETKYGTSFGTFHNSDVDMWFLWKMDKG